MAEQLKEPDEIEQGIDRAELRKLRYDFHHHLSQFIVAALGFWGYMATKVVNKFSKDGIEFVSGYSGIYTAFFCLSGVCFGWALFETIRAMKRISAGVKLEDIPHHWGSYWQVSVGAILAVASFATFMGRLTWTMIEP